MKFLFYLIVVISLIACNNTKKVTENNTTKSTSNNTNMSEINYRLIVSFISIGEGTDQKTKQKFEQFISQYEKINKTKLNYEIVNWGREGEVDYCFKLIELKEKQQESFVTETKELLKSSSLVNLTENTTCPHKR